MSAIIVYMLRGHRTIFNSLFETDVNVLDTPAPERKGRSEELVLKRNEALICRYYYYIKIHGMQYLATLAVLQQEFYLAERTIIDMLTKNSGILRRLHDTKPTLKYFRDRYPWMAWA